MRILREFQGEFQGKFQENSMRTTGKIPRWFQKKSKENSKDNSLGIPGLFQEALLGGTSRNLPGNTLYNFSTCLVPLITRSTRWWSCPLMITGKSNSLQVLSSWISYKWQSGKTISQPSSFFNLSLYSFILSQGSSIVAPEVHVSIRGHSTVLPFNN